MAFFFEITLIGRNLLQLAARNKLLMRRLLKPKVLEDIQPRSKSVFRNLERRVNLGYQPRRNLPVGLAVKFLGITAAIILFLGGSASAPINNQTMAQEVSTSPANQEERQALEAQLKELETQMDAYQGQIAGYQKQGSSLKGEISKLNGKISLINVQIKAINLSLSQIDASIADTASKIKSTEDTIDASRGILGNLLKQLYISERTNLLEIFLQHPKLSDFFNDVNSIDNLQNSLRLTIVKIRDLRGQLEDQRSQLAAAREDAASVKEYQAAAKAQTENIKTQKNTLLTVTKGQESKYQALLKETKETTVQIRSRIFQLLGGGQLSFEEAYKYAKLAGDATGVRPALILAVLDRESALGQNVGRCSYKTAMSPGVPPKSGRRDDISIFLALTSTLGLNPDTMLVSCANSDGAFGGAMGPAQFIPSTWNIYKNQISKITGQTPASPWNNADAFVATALYLRDAGATGNVSLSQERTAAAKYYAGGNWSRYLWTYGQAVVSLAGKFQEDIDTITG